MSYTTSKYGCFIVLGVKIHCSTQMYGKFKTSCTSAFIPLGQMS